MLKETRVTVKIPRPLYRRIQLVIDGSGFSSPTDFIVYVLRDLLGGVEAEARAGKSAGADALAEMAPEELKEIQRKLKNLGYLE